MELAAEQLSVLAKNLRILLLDVDGVLTDGGIILVGPDLEGKRFDVQDGMGINMVMSAGLTVGIVTSRTSIVVQRRCQELGIEELFQNVRWKPTVLDKLVGKYKIRPDQIAFIGDDIQDIPVMNLVGIPIAVQNARPEVKNSSVHVTQAGGGHGAVREAAEWLLELRGDKDWVCQSISNPDPVSRS